MKDVSRRGFLKGTGVLVGTAALPASAAQQEPAATEAAAVPRSAIRFVLNGAERQLEVEHRATLAEVLRDQLQQTGTRLGCDRGECGACTVLLDGRPVYACSNLAIWVDGREVRTVEGLADGETLHELQRAFIEKDAPQCGFCTSGQLMSAAGLLASNPSPTRDDVRSGLAGNLCRCSNYEHYVDAVLAAAEAKRRG